MTVRRIAASWSPGEIRAVLIEDGRIVDYAVSRPGAPDGVGDLHRGRIAAQAPELGGAFVALEGEDGFLPDTAGAKTRPEGTLLGLRVVRAAQGRKGKRLTARLGDDEAALTGEGPVRLIKRGPCAVMRLAWLAMESSVTIDDASLFASLRPSLGARVSLVPRAFDDAIEERLTALEEPLCSLAPGVTATVTPTPALVAIDLDSSGARSQDAANRAAAAPLAAELRLRNLSGAILVDFAGLSPKRRKGLAPALAEALAADPLAPRLLGFTTLGLAEILRARAHPPLHEIMAGPYAAGLKALRRLLREGQAEPSRPLALVASSGVIDALSADRAALGALAARLGRAPALRRAALPGALDWLVETDHG